MRVRCEECPFVGNDEMCWNECEYDAELLEEMLADEFEPEVADDDEPKGQV